MKKAVKKEHNEQTFIVVFKKGEYKSRVREFPYKQNQENGTGYCQVVGTRSNIN